MSEEEGALLVLGRAMLPARKAGELLRRYGSAAALLGAEGELPLSASQRATLRAARGQAARDEAMLARCGAHLVSLLDERYPPLLCEIHDPPPVLYVRGELAAGERRAVAIVGSRRTTPYGRAVAQALGRGLAEAGVAVVSGLALGIDAAAHEGALEAGGRAIAVLGCGIDQYYPVAHRDLTDRVAKAGAVITEFPPETAPLPMNFPIRNRVIAGMTLGTVVVEAPAKSGALITAGLALEQGREVFAVPGSINSELARGTHQLLKEGAKLVESVQDILEELDLEQGTTRAPLPTAGQDGGEQPAGDPLLAYLSLDPVGLEDLQEKTGLPAGELSARLLLLELRGLVGRLPGNRLIRLG